MNTGNNTVSSDFLRVLLALKDNVMLSNNVAEVCYVKEVSDLCKCTILSNSEKIECYKLQNLDVKANDVVLVIFSNTDFRQNLRRYIADQPLISVESELHSQAYGVIVGIIYRKEN